ncbi:hypothetical protein [Mastigocoleus testarum]|uniref:Uncharacterized protein n=1 Tax=Mastigocoleus testarum BC008 TaxID=371196 RepID=A0A0V7ZWF8_9CYAN|nr:hypothetical protein [Mastigocoleus testarum]KST68889.1 hypothetical protein BC008_02105 [Mastigocoleus testarum BC008]KST68907.1 hypothetical protein BC008_02195 [Mastigocoleus testarum BC008]
MKKVFALTILTSLIATPALAGETFVRNVWTNSNSRTVTDLNIDSKTISNRYEKYTTTADKLFIDGSIKPGKIDVSSKKYKDYTVHRATSTLEGKFNEDIITRVVGNIKTYTNVYTESHETTAGVR